MRRALKILAWLLGLFLLLILAGAVVIQSPRVQTFITGQVVERLRGQLDADIDIGLVTLRPFDAVVLHDVLMKDPAPVVNGMDTVACIDNLTVKFSLLGLLQNGSVHVKRLKLNGGVFNLSVEPDPDSPIGSTMNLYRVLRIQTKESAGPSHWGDLISAKYVQVSDFTFRYASIENALNMLAEGSFFADGSIDWNDFSVHVDDLVAGNLAVKDDLITGTVQRLIAQETGSGFRIDMASAQHVQVGLENVTIDGLHLQSGHTDAHLSRFVMDGAIDNYSDFIRKIRLDAQIADGSVIAMPTLRYFADGLGGITFEGGVRGHVSGTVEDLQLETLRIEDDHNDVQLRGNGRIQGLPEIEDTHFDFQLNELRFTLDGLGGFVEAWAPGTDLDLSQLARGERFRFSGHVAGLLNKLHVNGDIRSRIGHVRADATLQNAVKENAPIILGGTIRTEDLHLGKILNTPSLGPLTMETGLEARFDKKMEVRLDSLHISRLQALEYDYSDISAAGTYSDDAFDGRIIAADPNLNFLFQGTFNLSRHTRNAVYRFYASLGYADLHALHLDSRPHAKISLQASSNFLRTETHELLGDIHLSDIWLESETGRDELGDVTVQAHANDNVNRIRLASSFLDASYVGDAAPARFLNDLQYLVLQRDVPALLKQAPEPWKGATYDVNLNVKGSQLLWNFLVPGLYLEKNTRMALQVNDAGLLTAQVISGRIAYKDKFIKDLQLDFDNGNAVQTALITGKQISLSGTQILNNRISFFADDNQVGLGYTFDNGEQGSSHAELYISGDLDRDEKGLIVNARALPSNIYYKGNGWGITSGDIRYSGGDFSIQQLMARHDSETLLVDGRLSRDRTDTLTVMMDKFDIGLLNTLSGKLPSLEGKATGKALLLSPSAPSIGLLAGIRCDSTYVAGQRMGQLNIFSGWNDENQRFDIAVSNLLNGRNNVNATGYLTPDNGAIHASAQLNRFNMGYAAPLLQDVFAQFGGFLSGEVGLDGTLDAPHLSSKGLRMDEGVLQVDFTRVTYHASGNLELDDQGLHFQHLKLTDGQGGNGLLHGSILMNGFKDMRLDTHLQFTDMKVVEMPRGLNPLMYGSATASGSADITGPLNKILLNVDAVTSRGGDMHIALGGSSDDVSREMLRFTADPNERETDPYEIMMASTLREEEQSDLRLKLRIRATEDMQLSIDIDDESGINARGNGSIDIESRLSQGTFSLNGDYAISQGTFLFSAMNLVTRKFSIQDGSTIRFNGDVMNTDLNVTGLYTTKASLSNLLADGSAGSRRTVNCGIHITGRLSNPEVSFSIEVPDLNPATQAQVDAALNTVDKVQKQFIYLLIASNFLPGEESGITTGGSDVLFSNVSSIMSGQLNNIFQKLNIPLDMGLNYQTTQAGSNIFDVALSTQLFNNRVIVNGTVGNKKQIDGTSTNEVVGDIDIEIKLNRSGSLRVKLFSHSADQYTSYLDNSQRHGAGVSYQRDFNSFLTFLRTLFMEREKREAIMQQDMLEAGKPHVYSVDENGKLSLE